LNTQTHTRARTRNLVATNVGNIGTKCNSLTQQTVVLDCYT